MFPLRDNIPSRHSPVVIYVVMAACGFAFLVQSKAADQLIDGYAMIPARVVDPSAEIQLFDGVRTTWDERTGPVSEIVYRDAAPSAVPPWLTTLTCVFLHGGLMHLVGNLWFLWIFGDNVEDRLGHVGFLVFYFLAGLVASVTHLVTDPASQIPTVGASGAIAGVMGAYMVLYPQARVLTFIPVLIFFRLHTLWLPAVFVLGVWFAMQLWSGVQAAGAAEPGVAWWAHIGGFVFGVAGGWVVKKTRLGRPAVTRLRAGSDGWVVPRGRRRDSW